jgi:DtxR family transcriptional regulator, Mn-dependent transcriptional regulator
MLRYLARCGVALGDAVEMLEKEPFGGPLRVRFAGQVHTIGRELADAMRVELRA